MKGFSLLPLFIGSLMLLSCAYVPGKGSSVYVNPGVHPGLSPSMRVSVKPVSEIKFDRIVKQHLDYSCGSATVATIFNYYLGIEMDEHDVLKKMFEVGNKEKIIKRRGFSLLDMKKFAETMGYRAYGVKTNLETLAGLKKPAVVTIVIGNYKHFVVFRGVYKGRVFIADPAFGHTVLNPEDFKKIWYRNIALIIEPRDENQPNGLEITEADLKTVSAGTLRGELIPPVLPVYRNFTDF